MSLLTTEQVAAVMDIPVIRVERLTREHLLVPVQKDASGKPLFAEEDVKRYKVLAERLGGL
jgi:DNA-binding transcriptional MerR regulator